jgi:hypothetical protein
MAPVRDEIFSKLKHEGLPAIIPWLETAAGKQPDSGQGASRQTIDRAGTGQRTERAVQPCHRKKDF